MKKSRIALLVLAIASLAAVGYAASGLNSPKATKDCCGGTCSDCTGCCGK